MQLTKPQLIKTKSFNKEHRNKPKGSPQQENSLPKNQPHIKRFGKIRIDDRLSRVLRTNDNFNVLNFTFINETALKGFKDYDYSFSSSYFDYKKATNIKLTEDYLFVSLEDLNTTKVTVKYLVDRLRSYGNEKFYRISNSIEKMELIIKKVSEIMENFKEYYSQQMLDKTLLKFKGRAYFGIYNVYENGEFEAKGLFISKKLITMLGHDPYELAIRFTRLGAIRDFQISSASSYSELISNYIELMYDCSALIVQKGFSQKLFEESLTPFTKKFDVELLINNKQGRLIAETISHVPNPCYVIQQVTKVKNTRDDIKIIRQRTCEMENEMEIQGEGLQKNNGTVKIESNDTNRKYFSYKEEHEDLVTQEYKSISQIYDPFKKKPKKKQPKLCTYREKNVCQLSKSNFNQMELEE